MQKIGLKHHLDLQKRIPLDEAEQIFEVIRELYLAHSAEVKSVEIVGSFRRGYKEAGNLDILVQMNSRSDRKAHQEVKKAVLEQLKQKGLLLDLIAESKDLAYMVIQLDPHHPARQVDVWFTSEKEYPFQLLGRLGSVTFNISIRSWAKNKGYSLSNHGIEPLDHDAKIELKKRVPSRIDDIFRLLDLPVFKPEEMNATVDKHGATTKDG
ncbi:hypothetical protein GEMRC1_006517 [Eukaryota sp. GEM-RC1]